MLPKGTIVVRTGHFFTSSIYLPDYSVDSKSCDAIKKHGDVGIIFKNIKNNFYDRASYSSEFSINKNNYRLATQNEIDAYNAGIRHINDIPKWKKGKLLLI